MNLNTKLTTLDGQDFSDGATVKSVALMALQAALTGDEQIGAVGKAKLYQLSLKVHGAGDEVGLTAEDIASIKARVAVLFPSLIVGRVFEVIDPAALA